MNSRTPNYPFLFTVGGFLFGIGGPAGDVIKQTWPSSPPQLRPALVVIGCALMLFTTLGALWAIFGPKRDRSDEHETDAADVLDFLRNRSRWAEQRHRRLNFREFVNHLEEFRRAARDDNLRTSGIPAFGGRSEPMDSRHWADADIDPATAGRRGGVSTKDSCAIPPARSRVRRNQGSYPRLGEDLASRGALGALVHAGLRWAEEGLVSPHARRMDLQMAQVARHRQRALGELGVPHKRNRRITTNP